MRLAEFPYTVFRLCLRDCHQHLLCVCKGTTHCAGPPCGSDVFHGHLPPFKYGLGEVEVKG